MIFKATAPSRLALRISSMTCRRASSRVGSAASTLKVRIKLSIPIDLHVLGRPAGGDDVELTVPIQVRETQVLASHGVVINQSLAPGRPVLAWREQLDPNLHARLAHGAPAHHDLITARPRQVTACDGMTV